MTDLIQTYAQEPVWAVVGASNDHGKYGNRIFRTLLAAGYRVYPVNNRVNQVEGQPAFATLAALPEVPTVVNLVVSPDQALSIVQQAKQVGARAVWFQPGAEDLGAIRWARANGLDVVESCILVHHVQNPITQAVSVGQP